MDKHVSRAALGVTALWLVAAGAGEVGADTTAPRRVEVTASRYRFEPSRIEVTQGDVVHLVVHSADTDHGLAIKAFKVKVPIPKGGEPVAVSFVASRAGIFLIECSEYCGSGHKRMKGELVVAERTQ